MGYAVGHHDRCIRIRKTAIARWIEEKDSSITAFRFDTGSGKLVEKWRRRSVRVSQEVHQGLNDRFC